jgi:hypothetical protein
MKETNHTMRMKTFTRALAAALLLLAALVAPVSAQTALNETTLSAAVTDAGAGVIYVASATGFSAGRVVYVDREAMTVISVNSTAIRVVRGALNTAASTHGSGVLVYVGPAVAFVSKDLYGSCTPTAQRYTPSINPGTGGIFSCPTSVSKWVNLRDRVAVTCRALLIADMIDQSCFIADRQYLVTKITYIHTTPESAGTLTVIPRRQQSTEAAASGDALATAINAVAAGTAAQTLVTATLTTTSTLLILEAGDRLGLDFTDDTAGELAGVTVTFYLIPL